MTEIGLNLQINLGRNNIVTILNVLLHNMVSLSLCWVFLNFSWQCSAGVCIEILYFLLLLNWFLSVLFFVKEIFILFCNCRLFSTTLTFIMALKSWRGSDLSRFISHKKKLRLREIKWLTQCYRALRKWPNHDSNSSLFHIKLKGHPIMQLDVRVKEEHILINYKCYTNIQSNEKKKLF